MHSYIKVYYVPIRRHSLLRNRFVPWYLCFLVLVLSKGGETTPGQNASLNVQIDILSLWTLCRIITLRTESFFAWELLLCWFQMVLVELVAALFCSMWIFYCKLALKANFVEVYCFMRMHICRQWAEEIQHSHVRRKTFQNCRVFSTVGSKLLVS